MSTRKSGPKSPAESVAKGKSNTPSAAKTTYPAATKRRSRVHDSGLATADSVVHWPSHYGDVAEERGSGVVRRKNLNIDQGLLDQARLALGVRTETEAVELGLGAVLEVVEFQKAMLEGFDRLMASGAFTHDPDEALDFSAFAGPSAAR